MVWPVGSSTSGIWLAALAFAWLSWAAISQQLASAVATKLRSAT